MRPPPRMERRGFCSSVVPFCQWVSPCDRSRRDGAAYLELPLGDGSLLGDHSLALGLGLELDGLHGRHGDLLVMGRRCCLVVSGR